MHNILATSATAAGEPQRQQRDSRADERGADEPPTCALFVPFAQQLQLARREPCNESAAGSKRRQKRH